MGKGGSVSAKEMLAMVEDAPVKTGALLWPAPGAAAVQVRRMQRKAHQWAREDPARCFGDLYNLVCDPAFLVDAFERVAGNKGARTAGMDGWTVTRIRALLGVEEFLADIREQLKARTFVPAPTRRVEIPNGSGKMRRLGIPTVADRVVQASLKAVLEPIFEADFKPCSYGFRPNRRAQDAIAEIQHMTTRGYGVVLEADITACFDEIDHTALMDRVRRRVSDKRLLALVKAFLHAGVMTQPGVWEDTLTGTPQGGILSPLLANIALSALDEHFDAQWRTEMGSWHQRDRRKRRGEGNWKLVRYADDFVIVVNGQRQHAEALREEVAGLLAPLGLRLSPEKTRVVDVDEGFVFLGFLIQRRRKRGTAKYYVYTVPSRKAIKSITDRVSAATYRSTLNQDLDQLLRRLNRMLAGWANYFRHGVSKRTFNAIDSHAWSRIAGWLRRKHRIGRSGLRRFCDRGWRFASNGAVFTGASSVAVTRYRYRGADIATPWTPKPASLTG
jgi:RNA-directed DNA polymerase